MMKKYFNRQLFLLAAVLMSLNACAGSFVSGIDPADTVMDGKVMSEEDFLNDPVKQGDFGCWELTNHINYYYADKYKGEITGPYILMLINLAGFETERFGIAIGPDDDSRFTKNGESTRTKAKEGEVFFRFGLDIIDRNVAWNNGNGGVKYTLHGGRTWNTTSPVQCWPYIAFDNLECGWVSTPDYMLKTTDRGETFKKAVLPYDGLKIAALRDRAVLFNVYLSRNAELLTLTNDFRGFNESSVLRYRPALEL